MKIENLVIADIDGCESDGWALPLVRVRLVAEKRLSAISFELWFPKEEGNDSDAMFVVSSLGSKTQFIQLPPETPREVIVPVQVEIGNDASVLLTCDHLIANTGDDIRELSFVVLAIRGVPA